MLITPLVAFDASSMVNAWAAVSMIVLTELAAVSPAARGYARPPAGGYAAERTVGYTAAGGDYAVKHRRW